MESPTKKSRLKTSSRDKIPQPLLQNSSSPPACDHCVSESRRTTVYSKIHTNKEVNGTKCEILNVYGPNITYFSPTTTTSAATIHKVSYFRICEAPVPNFVGREDLLLEMHSLFKSCARKTGWLERTVIIHGLGGMGKSEIARKYVQLHKNDPIIQNVAWIDSETKTSLKKSFQKIARKFELEVKELDLEEITENVYEHFFENFDAGLFIFDNVEQLRDQEPYFGIIKYLPTQQQDRLPLILITSRFTEWEAPHGRNNTIGISELGDDQAIELLMAKLNFDKNQTKNTKIQEAVRNLAQAIQGYPLGLTLAASNINSSKFVNVADEIEKYIARLNKPKSGWIDDKLSLGSASKYTLVMNNVWEATFDKIRSMGAAGECALTLLNIMAFLPTDHIWKSEVDKILEFGYSPLKYFTLEGYSYLEKFSLISLLEKEDWRNDDKYFSIRVHRHIQRCTRERLDAISDYSFLLSVGWSLCQNQDNKCDVNDSVQIIHRHLKQRKWPCDSIRISIILLSRYWHFPFALELASDLSETIEAGVQDSGHAIESGYRTLLGLSLAVFSERNLRLENDEATTKVLRQWNEKHEELFDASVEIFTSALILKSSIIAADVCSEVQERISGVMEHLLNYKDDYKRFCIKIRDVTARTLDETAMVPQHLHIITKIYKALNVYNSNEPNQGFLKLTISDSIFNALDKTTIRLQYLHSNSAIHEVQKSNMDEHDTTLNQNSALGLKAALQLHYQFYTNNSLWQNPKYWENGPIYYKRLNDELRLSRKWKRNSSVASDWEKTIIDTFLTHGGLQVVQQNLGCCVDPDNYPWHLMRFIIILATDYNCSEAFKETPSFLHYLNEATTTAARHKEDYLLLWLALFPPKSEFGDKDGRMWSLYSVAEQMKAFLEDYLNKAESNRRLWFDLEEDSVIRALLPHLNLEFSESNRQEELHFKTAVALMDGDIRYRKSWDELGPQGWKNVFKTHFSTRYHTRREMWEVGMKNRLISHFHLL